MRCFSRHRSFISIKRDDVSAFLSATNNQVSDVDIGSLDLVRAAFIFCLSRLEIMENVASSESLMSRSIFRRFSILFQQIINSQLTNEIALYAKSIYTRKIKRKKERNTLTVIIASRILGATRPRIYPRRDDHACISSLRKRNRVRITVTHSQDDKQKCNSRNH